MSFGGVKRVSMENEIHTKNDHPWRYETQSTIYQCHCGRKFIKICSIQSECRECSRPYWWMILIRFKDEHKNNNLQRRNQNRG